MNRILCLLLAALTAGAALAETKVVTVTYDYVQPDDVSRKQAKQIALENAKKQAIADEFGTMISQNNYTSISNRKGREAVDFQSISMHDLRGEWLSNVGEPKYEWLANDEMTVCRVTVTMKIRSIESAEVDLYARLLRNEPNPRAEATEFYHNDQVYLHFRTPVDGYLAVYVIDGNSTANCMIPYTSQKDGIFPVKAGQEYILFDPKQSSLSDKDKWMVDECVLECSDQLENCQLVILFSPKNFVKANDTARGGDTDFRQLSERDLRQWIAKSRSADVKMQMHTIPFTIHPRSTAMDR